MRRVLQSVLDERERQDKKYGEDHDDNHTADDFCDFIRKRLDKIQNTYADKTARKLFVEIAALAMAELEAEERVGLRRRG